MKKTHKETINNIFSTAIMLGVFLFVVKIISSYIDKVDRMSGIEDPKFSTIFFVFFSTVGLVCFVYFGIIKKRNRYNRLRRQR
jgi:hypothetical protein